MLASVGDGRGVEVDWGTETVPFVFEGDDGMERTDGGGSKA